MAERGAMAEQQPEPDSPGKFRVFIKLLPSRTFEVPVSLDDSVWDLKVKLNAQDASLSPSQGMLIYSQKFMKDDLTLRDYEITPNCVLHYIKRARGGGGEGIKYQSLGKVVLWSSLTISGAAGLVELHSSERRTSTHCMVVSMSLPWFMEADVEVAVGVGACGGTRGYQCS
ncbi:uncharacterized protein RDI95_007518 [Morus bassanus]